MRVTAAAARVALPCRDKPLRLLGCAQGVPGATLTCPPCPLRAPGRGWWPGRVKERQARSESHVSCWQPGLGGQRSQAGEAAEPRPRSQTLAWLQTARAGGSPGLEQEAPWAGLLPAETRCQHPGHGQPGHPGASHALGESGRTDRQHGRGSPPPCGTAACFRRRTAAFGACLFTPASVSPAVKQRAVRDVAGTEQGCGWGARRVARYTRPAVACPGRARQLFHRALEPPSAACPPACPAPRRRAEALVGREPGRERGLGALRLSGYI